MMTRSGRTARRPQSSFAPTVDRLEGRVVLSAAPHTSISLPTSVVHTAATTTLNQQVVNYLNQHLGKRIGSGECTDLATEALRVAGAKFFQIGVDNPTPGDYVWGSLVKSYTMIGGRVVDSQPGAAIEPGDVLQFRNATFSTGVSASHHTAVVAAVDSSGRVTKVFQQNMSTNGGAAVRVDTLGALDMSKLTGGYVRVYRPVARVAIPLSAQFTMVNNAATAERVTFYGSAVAFTPADTTGSMFTLAATGTTTPRVVLNGVTYTMADDAGYQIVGAGASATIQRITA